MVVAPLTGSTIKATLDDLDVHQVEVHGMGVRGEVENVPDLDVAGPGIFGGRIEIIPAPGGQTLVILPVDLDRKEK